MPLIDDAVFSVGTGRFYTAAVGAAAPADLRTPTNVWTEIGHTSLDDILSFTSEGGDATVIGTLQKKTLRTTYSNRTETFGIILQQWDEDSLRLYFGDNATLLGDGDFLAVPDNPTPTEGAFLAVFEDGVQTFALYAPKAELFRGDDLSFADTESLAGLPISIKPVNHSNNTWRFAVTPLTDLTP